MKLELGKTDNIKIYLGEDCYIITRQDDNSLKIRASRPFKIDIDDNATIALEMYPEIEE